MLRLQLLILGMFSFAHAASAQESSPVPSALSVQYEYVTLLAVGGGNAFLDYGQAKELGKQAPVTELEKDFVAIQKLPRAMEALNYLSSRGWEYVGMGNRQRSSGSTSAGSFSISTSTEYLLRRRKQQ